MVRLLGRSKRPFANLKVALVTDELTRACLARECRVVDVTPDNYPGVFRRWRPDLLLVESAWKGHRDKWRYRIASYPDVPERNNEDLARLVGAARHAGIPAVFWNREDGVHFDRFIDSARLFDRVLTVDATMLPAYRAALGEGARFEVMMFAASRFLHYPRPGRQRRRAAFVGSYSSHVHDGRRAWQNQMLEAARPLGLTVYDRNSERKAGHYRFPERPWIDVQAAVPHHRVPDIYRGFLVNLNVNTITDSPTAFSRRLVEILGCGGFALTNRSPAIEEHFADFCVIAEEAAEASALFERLAVDGPSARERDMCRAAAEHVRVHHSWQQRLPTILDMAGL